MEVRQIDRFEPNWRAQCMECGHSPTVNALRKDVVVLQTGLCGACCWGSADQRDPDTWNESKGEA